jgi:hypothetical protein
MKADPKPAVDAPVLPYTAVDDDEIRAAMMAASDASRIGA